METIILIVAIVLIAFSLLIFLLSRYKKCPSDKIMVIYGNVGKTKTALRARQSAFTAARRSLNRFLKPMNSWT